MINVNEISSIYYGPDKMNISERLLLLPEHTRLFYIKLIKAYNDIGIPLDLLFLSDIIKSNNDCYIYSNDVSRLLNIAKYESCTFSNYSYIMTPFDDWHNIDNYIFRFFSFNNNIRCALFNNTDHNYVSWNTICSRNKFTEDQMILLHYYIHGY